MHSSPSILFHPLAIILVGNQIITLTSGFTSAHSSLRPATFALLVAYICAGLAKYPNYTHTTNQWGAMLGGAYATCILVYFDRLMVRQWAFEDRSKIFPADFAGERKPKNDDELCDKDVPKHVDGPPVTGKTTQGSFGSRLAFGRKVARSSRMVGTPWEAKNVAPFSPRDPDYVPTRACIIVQNLWIIATSLLLREIFMEVEMSIDPFYTARAREPFLTRLGEVSREEVMARVVLAIAFWVLSYCGVQILVGTMTLLSALNKSSEIRELRPLFGSLSEAYTVRGYWGKFWHQNLRNNLEGPSRFLTHTVLRLPRGSLPARYSALFFTFLLSGAIHVASDVGKSVPAAQSGALRFFCTNALAIALEDGAQELARRLNGGRRGWWWRVLGYAWVVAFLAWSTPCWQYPRMRLVRREEEWTFGFGVVRSLLGLHGTWGWMAA